MSTLPDNAMKVNNLVAAKLLTIALSPTATLSKLSDNVKLSRISQMYTRDAVPTSREWQTFLRQYDLEPSMSRRGNCHDNAGAESFFQVLKRGRIRRRAYPPRENKNREIFRYIRMLYTPMRNRANNSTLSPVDFEFRQQKLKQSGVW